MEGASELSRISVLIDHNIEGYAVLLWIILKTEGWLELCPIDMVMFKDVGLADDINDRDLWRFVQAHKMILLTANRNMEGQNSLEQTIREENRLTSLPVLTISNDEYLKEKTYRKRCIEKLLEILFDLDNYLGTGRIFIP
jgi:hypothetical protein